LAPATAPVDRPLPAAPRPRSRQDCAGGRHVFACLGRLVQPLEQAKGDKSAKGGGSGQGKQGRQGAHGGHRAMGKARE